MEQHDGCKDVYKNCKHYRVGKYCSRFLWLISIFTLILIVAVVCMHCAFTQSQQKIIDTHKEHLDKTQECLTSIYNNLKNEPVNCDSLIYILECDTILAQKIVDYPAVKNLILGLANNMSYRAMVDELKKDSILINRQLANAQHATNELLELHFNRIQHEYTVLALWAGILMIVFLIFSFYSLYKTDDIAKQSKENLKNITAQGDDVLSGLKKQQEALMSQANKTILQLNKETQESQNKMDTLAETFNGRISTLEVTATRLEQLFQMMEDIQAKKSDASKKTRRRNDGL